MSHFFPRGLENLLSCSMYKRDYFLFKNMTSEEIYTYLKEHEDDPITNCEYGIKYLQESSVSMVPEVRI